MNFDKRQGTQAGNPIEASSLSKIFTNGQRKEALIIGSIKSNIGHLGGGSGIAGVIKTVIYYSRDREAVGRMSKAVRNLKGLMVKI